MTMTMTELLKHPAFRELACILRATELSGFLWRWSTPSSAHDTRDLPLSERYYHVRKDLQEGWRMGGGLPLETLRMRAREMFDILAETHSLGWKASDDALTWLDEQLRILPAKDARGIIPVLLAFGSSMTLLLTPMEAAILTAQGESTWRKRILAGEVVGTFKKGKQWLIQDDALRLLGYDIPQAAETDYARRARYFEQLGTAEEPDNLNQHLASHLRQRQKRSGTNDE